MKTLAILLFVFCYAECRKVVPIDKNANLAFINMEGGVGAGPNKVAQPAVTQKSPQTPPLPQPPTPSSNKLPPQPVTTPKAQVTTKAAPVVTPAPTNQITPKKVNPPVVSNPVTTPGTGSVKQLINFYDSRGNASPIRPYSYSQAVKQG